MLTRQTRRGMSGIEILTISITLLLLFTFVGSEMWRRSYERSQRDRQVQENSVRESLEFRRPLNGAPEIGAPEDRFAPDVVYRVTHLAIDETTGLGLAWVKPEHDKGFATWHPDVLRVGLGQHFKFIARKPDNKKVLVIVDLKKVEGDEGGGKMSVMAEGEPK